MTAYMEAALFHLGTFVMLIVVAFSAAWFAGALIDMFRKRKKGAG